MSRANSPGASSAAAFEKILARLKKVPIGAVSKGKEIGKGRFKHVSQGRFQQRDVVMLSYSTGVPRGQPQPRQRPPTKKEQEEEIERNVNELRILAQLSEAAGPNSPHVPLLFGACPEQNTILIFQELAPLGSLKGALQDERFRSRATLLHKIACCSQMARAVGFLEANGVVHADLSCRNVLLFRFEEDARSVVAKVSDFGLSVILPEGQDSTILKQPQATRWCAPETVADMKLSGRADMWSLGVTMWEFYADGAQPWPNRAKRLEVANRLRDLCESRGALEGGSDVSADFPRQNECPLVVHNTVLKCLAADEMARPSFTDLAATLDRIFAEGGETDSAAMMATQVYAAAAPEANANFVERQTSWAKCGAETGWDRVINSFAGPQRDILESAESLLRAIHEEGGAENMILSRVASRAASRGTSRANSPPPRTPRLGPSPRPGGDSSVGNSSPLTTGRRSPGSAMAPPPHHRVLLPRGAWTLWFISGQTLMQQDFQTEVDGLAAFAASSHSPCVLRDPAGADVASAGWSTCHITLPRGPAAPAPMAFF